MLLKNIKLLGKDTGLSLIHIRFKIKDEAHSCLVVGPNDRLFRKMNETYCAKAQIKVLKVWSRVRF